MGVVIAGSFGAGEAHEAMLTKQQLARLFQYTTRWVELRVVEGMPYHQVGGQKRFLLSECRAWLEGR